MLKKFKYTLIAEIEVEAAGVMIAEAFIKKHKAITVKVSLHEPVRTPSNPYRKFPAYHPHNYAGGELISVKIERKKSCEP